MRGSFAALALVAGCTTVQKGEDGRVHALSERALAQLPVAAQYGDPIGDVENAAEAAEFAQQFEAGLPAAARDRYLHDPRLDHLARIRAVAFAEVKQGLSADFEQQLAWRFGIAHPLTGGPVRWVSGRAKFGAADEFTKDAARDAPTTGRFRYGIARLHTAGKLALAMVRVRDTVEVDPLPKTVKPGDTVVIKGRFLIPAPHPRMAIFEDGVAREQPIATAADQSFTASITLSQTAGVRYVDLIGPDDDGVYGRPTALFFPIYAGVPEPANPVPEAVGNTLPTPDAIAAAIKNLTGRELPRRPDVDLDAAAVLAAQNEAPKFHACGAHWWHRSRHDSVEEIAWWIARAPHVRFALAKRQPRAGIAVELKDDSARSAIVLCDDPAPAPAASP